MASFKSMSLTTRIVIGMFAGITLGAIIQFALADNAFVNDYIVEGLFFVGGKIFVNSLKMLVVPLVFVSLICGTCSLSDPSKLGRLGGKAIALYMATTAIAITTAITLALVIAPGSGQELVSSATFTAKEAPSLAQVIINIMPSNPFESMAKGNMLQIIMFALLFGIAISLSGESGKRIADFFNDLNVVVMKLVVILMNLAPYGVFFLMAKLFSQIELSTIGNLIQYFLVVLGALFIHALITSFDWLLLKIITRIVFSIYGKYYTSGWIC